MENESRFWASPEEKLAHVGRQLPITDYQITYPDSFVSVLIDGNASQFYDHFVAGDSEGGERAAMALAQALAVVVERLNYSMKVIPLMVGVYGSPEFLSQAFLDADVTPSLVNYGWFLQGFNRVESLVEFIAVEDGRSGIFFVTVVTDQSIVVDRKDDETVKQQSLVTLRQMFGKDDVPEPLDFMYPRWSTTPWAYGSYSNWPPGLTLEGHQNLRANVGRVWFAGEAISDEFYGYLHGAYFEGKYVGETVAACANRSEAGCTGETYYETLSGTSEAGEFGAENGWFQTSFQTVGDVDLQGGGG